MKFNFFLLTTFLLQATDAKRKMHIRCLGSREILKPDSQIPKHVLGMIEFESSYIPVIDPGAAFGIEPVQINNFKCILIIEHNYKSQKLYTGVIIQDVEEIEKLAAGVFECGTGHGASANMHFVLRIRNDYENEHQIFEESHKILSLLIEQREIRHNLSPDFEHRHSYDFIKELGKLNLCERQIILDELATNPELWDKDGNIMCL